MEEAGTQHLPHSAERTQQKEAQTAAVKFTGGSEKLTGTLSTLFKIRYFDMTMAQRKTNN